MYREKAFEEIRDELINRFQQIELKDFISYHEWASPHYKILKRLAELNEFNIPVETKNVEEIIEENRDKQPKETNPAVENANYPIGYVFTVDKKAFGAFINDLKYPIHESLVREMGIENGNKVKITGTKGTSENGIPRWEFKIVDHTTTPVPGLMEVTQGIVKKVGHTFVVSETVGKGTIWVNESPAILYINDPDVSRHSIKEGDIIDGRFYENNVVGSFRITYKYKTEELSSIKSIESRKLEYRKNNISETETGINMLDRLDKQPFLNRHIVLVGLEGRKHNFANHLKGTGIKLTHLTGDESKTSIRSTLKKADYVLISTFENSHDASKFTAKTCKELNVPCTHTHSDGLHGILMDALELIRCVEENKAM